MAHRSMRPMIGKCHRVGHVAIDLDHRAIADWWTQVVTCEELQFPFFIARLKKLMRTHFDHEAALVEQAGGRLCECHRREHRVLLELCDQAIALGRRNWRRGQSLVRTKLPKLFRAHIASMDQIAALFINTTADSTRALNPVAD